MTKPKPPAPEWREYKPGFEQNAKGQLRTKGYQPPPAPKPVGDA